MNEFRDCLTMVHSIDGTHPTARSALLRERSPKEDSRKVTKYGCDSSKSEVIKGNDQAARSSSATTDGRRAIIASSTWAGPVG
jgi:hypothetical protein